MNEWWQGLGDRERTLVGSGGIVLAALLFFLLVIEPVQDGLARAAAEQAARARVFHSLEAIAARAGEMRAQQVSSGSLPPEMTLERAIDETAQSASLRASIASMTPERNFLKVLMNDAPLGPTLTWLVSLREQYGIRVVELESTRGSAAGTSNLSMTFGASR